MTIRESGTFAAAVNGGIYCGARPAAPSLAADTKGGVGAADRVGGICDRIRDTDVSDTEAWESIRQEIDDIQVN